MNTNPGEDGRFFDFSTAKGRLVTGVYNRQPNDTKPHCLTLFTLVIDRTGTPKGLTQQYDVTNYLDHSGLLKCAEALEQSAEAAVRGKSAPEDGR